MILWLVACAEPAVDAAGTVEVCNGVDDDGDGIVDEEPVIGGTTWYADEDGDGYGFVGAARVGCRLEGYVADGSDCNDAYADVHAEGDPGCAGALVSATAAAEVSISDSLDQDWVVWDAAMDGDLDGDGLDDVVLGAMGILLPSGELYPYVPPGRVHVFLGAALDGALDFTDARATIEGGDWDFLGASIAYVPDLDADGYDELLVGAPGYAGHVWLIEGELLANGVEGAEDVATLRFDAPSNAWPPGRNLGESLDAADIDGDGHADVVMGAEFSASGSDGLDVDGGVYAFFDALTEGPRAYGELDADVVVVQPIEAGGDSYVGSVVEAGADLDGDGLGELLVGDSARRGAVYGFVGASLAGGAWVEVDDADFVVGGGDHGVGASISAGPDFDGDGLGDLAVTADDGGYAFSGACVVAGTCVAMEDAAIRVIPPSSSALHEMRLAEGPELWVTLAASESASLCRLPIAMPATHVATDDCVEGYELRSGAVSGIRVGDVQGLGVPSDRLLLANAYDQASALVDLGGW